MIERGHRHKKRYGHVGASSGVLTARQSHVHLSYLALVYTRRLRVLGSVWMWVRWVVNKLTLGLAAFDIAAGRAPVQEPGQGLA